MSKIKTTGDLRAELCNILEGVVNEEISKEQSEQVTRVAAQINKSFQVEAKVASIKMQMGKNPDRMGRLSIS